MNQSNNILIIGNGYVGNHLLKHLKNKDFNVQLKGSSDLDYHDVATLSKFIFNNDINTVINCSGFTGRPNIDEAETKKDLCWKLNVLSPLVANRACERTGAYYVHISSGCIYDGYEKEWGEDDVPNYGMFSNNSSFYSKSKHAFEMLSEHMRGAVIRIRMPFNHDHSGRNYLHKIRKYDNIINFQNSKTYIPDLCAFIENLLLKRDNTWGDRETFNLVNPEPLFTGGVCEIMEQYGYQNDNWKIVPLESLEIAAGRSNCILNGAKADKIYKMRTETEALIDCYEKLKEDQNKAKEAQLKWMEDDKRR